VHATPLLDWNLPLSTSAHDGASLVGRMPARGLAAKSDSGLLITARYLLTLEDLLGYMNGCEFKLQLSLFTY
jgi:hypothetical protein